MSRTASHRALVGVSLLIPLATALQPAATRAAVHDPASSFPPSIHRLVPGPPGAGRTATPGSAMAPDGAGGVLVVAAGLSPDSTRRLHAQKLDPSGAATWGPQGVAVATTPGFQTDPAVAPDGAGGLVVVWKDARASAPGLYAQHVSAAGVRTWGDEGIAVSVAAPQPGPPRAVADGSGGVIVAWQDWRNGPLAVFAQHLNALGEPLWAADGLRLYATAFDQRDVAIAPDGTGGAILVWEDQRSGASVLYGQRLSGAGSKRWGPAGLALTTAAAMPRVPAIAVTDTFLALAWLDDRPPGGARVYGQRVTRQGVPAWAADGVLLCDVAGTRGAPAIVADGAGGAFVGWSEQRDLAYYVDVYAQHVDAGGSVTWPPQGALVFGDAMYHLPAIRPPHVPSLVPDGAGGLLVAYEQWNLFGELFDNNIVMQHLDPGGVRQLPAEGVRIERAPLGQWNPVAVGDGAGGMVVSWLDYRSGDPDVYAQRVSAGGIAAWDTAGVPVHLHPGVQRAVGVIPDGAGGAIVCFEQKVGANYDLHALRLDASGAAVAPRSVVCDAPGLQRHARIVSDGDGGAFVAWSDYRGGRSEAYVQHLDANLSPVWTEGGVKLKQTLDDTADPWPCPDGSGGVVVAFRQLEPSTDGDIDVWAQRLDGGGAPLWGVAGVAVSTVVADFPIEPRCVPDGTGGWFVPWVRLTLAGAFHLLIQRLTPAGAAAWPTGGVLLTATYQLEDPMATVHFPVRLPAPGVAPDGTGGAIAVWEDARAGAPDAPDLYVQHLDAGGAGTWPVGGHALAGGAGAQAGVGLLPDGGGGAFVAWSNGGAAGGADVVAQRLDAAGAGQWTGGPRLVASAPGAQDQVSIAPDGAGGFVAVWRDGRAGAGELDIHAQRMDGAGTAQWGAGGIAVCDAAGAQRYPVAATDGSSGAYVAWLDARDGRTTLARLQHLTASGDTTMAADGVTDALASLVRADALPDGVHLEWRLAHAGVRPDVERCLGGGSWATIASPAPDGSGAVGFVDTEVATRGRRGYRLAWNTVAGRVAAGEAWLEFPAASGLAITTPSPHPVRGPLVVGFTLPRAGSAELDLFDVRGRRVGACRLESAPAGAHRWWADRSARLDAGIYLVRLRQDGRSVVRRICVLR